MRLVRMVCSEDTRIILVRAERPYVQSAAARVTYTVCSRGYRWAREGADPRSLVEGLKSAESLFSCSAMCSFSTVGHHASFFIGEWGGAGYGERKGEKRGRRRPPGPLRPSSPSCGSH